MSKNYLSAKIEPKRKYKWLPAKRSEGAEGFLTEPREDPSFYVHNRQQRIKSLKIVVESSNKNQYSYFYIPNLFLKLTRPDPTMLPNPTWDICLWKLISQDSNIEFWNYDITFDWSPWLIIVLLKFEIDIFYSLETMLFLLKFTQFSEVLFHHNFWLIEKF